ncbi:hypothetical protein BN2127_JRS5_02224 [Bacillus amyloliquefaciens]|nr:hypothetical protein BN2127_JRS5_02224 [Bacillus amyloliquefaciens]
MKKAEKPLAITMTRNSIKKSAKKAEKPQAKIMTKIFIKKSAKKAETDEAANKSIKADNLQIKSDPAHQLDRFLFWGNLDLSRCCDTIK